MVARDAPHGDVCQRRVFFFNARRIDQQGCILVALARVVPPANLWLAGAKGIIFGLSIALVACHFGRQVRPNTNSLSINTTASVVVSITTVIVLDALFAIFARGIGNPIG